MMPDVTVKAGSTATVGTPLLRADDLVCSFAVRGRFGSLLRRGDPPSVRALNGVSLGIARGETLAVVGESGCGKSTLARALVRLVMLDAGQIDFAGVDVRALHGDALRRYNRRVQLVFQDPYGSLNPRMTVGQILGESLAVHHVVPRKARDSRIAELLSLVRLPVDAADRLPHHFSGGQRQRIAIARALSVEPELLIADEVVSALDVSVQAQILNLLLELQQRLGLAILFVSHDLRVVRHLAHRVAVMYLGRVVEIGPADVVFDAPRHPYTQALLRAAPKLVPGRRTQGAAIVGELPSPMAIPAGCPFHPRCPNVMAQCRTVTPATTVLPGGHQVSCHLVQGAPAQADVDRVLINPT
jgi:oligopeptide/dipeptide ABC transporter ATP-binding protein